MSIITEGLILKMKQDVTAAINTTGTVEFAGDTTLQAIFDLALEALTAPDDTAALADIRRERTRQINELKRLPEDDDRYISGEMAYAAAAYATHSVSQHPQGLCPGCGLGTEVRLNLATRAERWLKPEL